MSGLHILGSVQSDPMTEARSCRICGARLAAEDRFCSSCGGDQTKGRARSATDPGVPAEDKRTRSDRGSPNWGRRLLLLAGLVAVVGLGGLVYLGHQAAVDTAYAVSGEVWFNAVEPRLGTVSMTEDCPDFGPTGAKITVQGPSGTVLGIGTLANGRPDVGRGGAEGPAGYAACVFDFTVANLPDATFYTFAGPLAGEDSGRTFSREQLIAAGWRVSFNGT